MQKCHHLSWKVSLHHFRRQSFLKHHSYSFSFLSQAPVTSHCQTEPPLCRGTGVKIVYTLKYNVTKPEVSADAIVLMPRSLVIHTQERFLLCVRVFPFHEEIRVSFFSFPLYQDLSYPYSLEVKKLFSFAAEQFNLCYTPRCEEQGMSFPRRGSQMSWDGSCPTPPWASRGNHNHATNSFK